MTRQPALWALVLLLAGTLQPAAWCADKRPNILLMMTDDQGYGDVGCHGNDVLRTPNLDRLAEEGIELTQFVVMPNCSPTRASLMTGRYHYRTGVTEVTKGCHLMQADEITIAETLRDAGYRTGIFGKWHLGEMYPMRPSDQGFEESLTHKGGGIGQAAGPEGNSYFDPILEHNNVSKRYEGYCDDIFADAAMEFMEKNREGPFFAYYATNLPHFPLVVSDERADPYRKLGLHEHNALTYGMIENIDANVGRMLAKLEQLGIERDTIVIFLSDNGPRSRRTKNDVYPGRYVANLRGTKTSVYDNGLRVPFFIRWPGGLQGGRKINTMAAHIDLLPTLLDACDVDRPAGVKIDGMSLMPLLRDEPVDWPNRVLFFQWHNGPIPFQYVHFAARTQRYKLIQPQDNPHGIDEPPSATELQRWLNTLELYDIENDPSEIRNLAREHPEIVEQLLNSYEDWFSDVTGERDYHNPQRIHIGTTHQNPVILSRFDLRTVRMSKNWGGWEIQAEPGRYRLTVQYVKAPSDGIAHVRFADVHRSQPIRSGSAVTVFEDVSLPGGPGRFEAYLKFQRQAEGVRYVDVERVD
jgi:arylsulfatase A